MPINQRRSILPSLLAGAGLVMACIVYAEIRARPVIEHGISFSERAITMDASPAHRQEMPEKARFTSIIQRPLFSPTRRPDSQVEAAPALAPALDAKLNGIVISPGESFALVEGSAGDSPMRVKEGDEVTGWTVARIEPDRVVVRRGDVEQQLFLDFGAAAPPSPTTMPTNALPNDQATEQGGQQRNGQGKNQAAEEQTEPVPPPEADEPASTAQKQSTKTHSK